MPKKYPFYPKELSWLAFNERVLQEAADETVPIVERMRFLGIYSNNLDEFYRVRVANVKRLLLIDKEHGQEEQRQELMKGIQEKTRELSNKFDLIYKDLVQKLARYHIHIAETDSLSDFHLQWLKRYFHNKVQRYLIPIWVDEQASITSRLEDNIHYLLVVLRKGEQSQYAMLEVPTDHRPRFVQLPTEKSKRIKKIILLDDIINLHLNKVFNDFVAFDSIEAYSFKMTRDAEYDLKDEIDQSLMEQMSDGIKERLQAEPVRCVYDNAMPRDMVILLRKVLNMSNYDSLISGGRYRNFKDFIGFPNVGRPYLENKKLPALRHNKFDQYPNAFEAISAKDILLYYPYHKFSYFTEMVRQAAFDPSVLSIRLNIYRVAKKSRIINSLIDAVRNGKKVTVVVELRARFDEQANIEWAKTMTDAGIRVVFGLPSLKVHSKLCLIKRKEQDKVVSYAHIGTGNFNESTAKIYTDFSLFTRDQQICDEVANVFEFVEHSYKRFNFRHLMVSPINTRKNIYKLIDGEIANAKRGETAEMLIKVNNLVDNGLIERLYKASQAGVKIRMLIRGMCTLIPGVEGLSENISIISVVDRFLEHPRVMVFHHGGDKQVYISSADWMTRNLDERVEVGCPIYDSKLKKNIIDLLELQFKDTTKARIIDQQQSNAYVKRGRRKKIRSQEAIYETLKVWEANS